MEISKKLVQDVNRIVNESKESKAVKLELKDLMSKAGARIGFLVRPQGEKAPKKYEAVQIFSLRDDPIKEFLKVNKNWKPSDISGMVDK